MINFKNLETHPEPQSTLFPQEINALLGVIQAYLQEYESRGYYGTCILDGQEYNEKAKCIFRFNLKGGPYRRKFFGMIDRTSDEIAEESINEILKPKVESRYARWLDDSVKPLPSGIYRDGELEVLVLNASYGRFLFTFHSQDQEYQPCHYLNEEMYYVMVEALANMGKEDYNLQHSNIDLIAAIPSTRRSSLTAALSLTRKFFYPDKKQIIPEIQAWREWHESANNEGELTLFFE